MKKLFTSLLCVLITACVLCLGACQVVLPGAESSVDTDKKVYLKYVSASSELIPLLKKGEAKFGVLGEPAVSMANAKTGTSIVLDLQAEYKKINGENAVYPQAGVLVKEDLTQDNWFMAEFYGALEANEDWLMQNASSVKEKLNSLGSSLAVDFTQEILQRCNLGSITSYDLKQDIENYFTVIKEFDSTFIGGNLPTEGFYNQKPQEYLATGEDKGNLNIAVPDGAPALAVLSLDGKKIGGYTVSVSILSNAQMVMGNLTNGTSSVVVLPSNVCAKMYNKGMSVKLASINVFGVLYMVGSEQITTIADLNGKTVYNIGVGGTPDLTLKYLLKENGISVEEI